MSKKAVVNRVANLTVSNIDIVKYFRDGVEEKTGHIHIRDNVLYCETVQAEEAVAVKVDKYTLINGDDVDNLYGYFSKCVEKLQDFEEDEITTSFECIANAGVDLNKLRVLEITQDLSKSVTTKDSGFKDFEKNIPQGSTYSQHPTNSDEPSLKRYHRAGSLLFKEGKHTYICSVDEDSYFVTKLPTNPKTIDNAFKALKPKKVQEWEKKNGIAIRQGEWFFIPVDIKKPKGMRRKGLPLLKDGGNKHIVSSYVRLGDINYVQGHITHVDHETMYLEEGVTYEAIMNTALGSWSVQGVD